MRSVSKNDLPSVSSDPGNLTSGNIWHNSTENRIKYYDGTSIITLVQEPSFGFNFTEYSEPTLVQNNTTSFADVLNETTPSFIAGTYIILYSYLWQLYGSTSVSYIAEVLINSSVVSTHREEVKEDEGTQRHMASGFVVYNHVSQGTINLQIQARKSGGGGGVSAYTQDARVVIFRVGN